MAKLNYLFLWKTNPFKKSAYEFFKFLERACYTNARASPNCYNYILHKACFNNRLYEGVLPATF